MGEGYVFHQCEVIVYLDISLKQVNLLWYWNNIEASWSAENRPVCSSPRRRPIRQLLFEQCTESKYSMIPIIHARIFRFIRAQILSVAANSLGPFSHSSVRIEASSNSKQRNALSCRSMENCSPLGRIYSHFALLSSRDSSLISSTSLKIFIGAKIALSKGYRKE